MENLAYTSRSYERAASDQRYSQSDRSPALPEDSLAARHRSPQELSHKQYSLPQLDGLSYRLNRYRYILWYRQLSEPFPYTQYGHSAYRYTVNIVEACRYRRYLDERGRHTQPDSNFHRYVRKNPDTADLLCRKSVNPADPEQ